MLKQTPKKEYRRKKQFQWRRAHRLTVIAYKKVRHTRANRARLKKALGVFHRNMRLVEFRAKQFGFGPATFKRKLAKLTAKRKMNKRVLLNTINYKK